VRASSVVCSKYLGCDPHEVHGRPLRFADRRDQKAVVGCKHPPRGDRGERRELKERIAALAAQLKRDER